MKMLVTMLIGFVFFYSPQEADKNNYFYFGNTNLVGDGPLENGKKSGDWTIYKRIEVSEVPVESVESVPSSEVIEKFDLSKSVFKISFKEDLPDGLMEEFHPNGKIKKLVTFANGKLNGDFFQFNELGDLQLSGSYVQDQKSGEWASYYDGGIKKSEFNYEEGLLSGITTNFYPDGTVSELVPLKSGQLEGTFQSFYPTGVKQKEVQFEEGKENGPFLLYYPDGKVSAKGEFQKGSLNGIWEFFTTEGVLISKGNYQAGQKNGKWVEQFDAKSGFYSSGDYLVGLKMGTWKVMSPDGFVHQEEKYFQDELMELSEFKTIEGELLESGKLTKGRGKRILYDSEGNILEKGRYAKGKREGLWYEYFPKTDQVATTGAYVANAKVGLWYYYDFAGQLVSQEDFSKDEHGDFRNPPTPEKQLEDRLGVGRFLSNDPQAANDLGYLNRFNFINSSF
jgi:antitoxin component YwqK of YwqJK toxin-antitoxin module